MYGRQLQEFRNGLVLKVGASFLLKKRILFFFRECLISRQTPYLPAIVLVRSLDYAKNYSRETICVGNGTEYTMAER